MWPTGRTLPRLDLERDALLRFHGGPKNVSKTFAGQIGLVFFQFL